MSNIFSAKLVSYTNFKSREELDKFMEEHTSVRTICVESDEGKMTELDVEEFEIEEVVELAEDEDIILKL